MRCRRCPSQGGPMKTVSILRRIVAIAVLAVAASAAHADVIMDWNARADSLAGDLKLTPTNHARALALMHVAMFEAVNAIERRYQPYRLNLTTDRNTSREVAAA